MRPEPEERVPPDSKEGRQLARLRSLWESLSYPGESSSKPQHTQYYTGRLILGLAMLYDWFIRFQNREFWYAGYGALPREHNPIYRDEWHYSVFYLSDSPTVLTLLFLVWLAVITWFLVGVRPRLSSLFVLVFLNSHGNANLYVSFCIDIYVAQMIWLALMPPGDRRSAFFHGFVIQLGLIYTVSGLYKLVPNSEWTDGTAISVVGLYTNIINPLGVWLSQFPLWITKPVTWCVLAMEILALPALWWRRTRHAAVYVLVVFHAATAITMNVGELPLIMMGGLLMVLDERSWLVQRIQGMWQRIESHRFRMIEWWRTMTLASERRGLPPRVAAFLGAYLGFLILADVYNRPGRELLARWELHPGPMPVGRVNHFIQGVAGVRQSWRMFASPLPQHVMWPVVHGVTLSGKEMDLLTGKEPSWETPPNLAYRFNQRDYKFWTAFYEFHSTSQTNRIEATGQYLVWDFNRNNTNDILRHIGIWFGYTGLDGGSPNWVKIW